MSNLSERPLEALEEADGGPQGIFGLFFGRQQSHLVPRNQK